MTSAAYCEKKKKAIPPPIIAIQAAICLGLDMTIVEKTYY